ncbi:hypothetical protein GGI35DRAFT_282645 [Trichoderma velutinum]
MRGEIFWSRRPSYWRIFVLAQVGGWRVLVVNLAASLEGFGRIYYFYFQLLAIIFLFPPFIYLYLNHLADRRHTTSRNAVRHKLLLVQKAIFPIDMCQRQKTRSSHANQNKIVNQVTAHAPKGCSGMKV